MVEIFRREGSAWVKAGQECQKVEFGLMIARIGLERDLAGAYSLRVDGIGIGSVGRGWMSKQLVLRCGPDTLGELE